LPEQHGGHEMLNHLGRTIYVTRRTLRALDMRGYLRRHHASGMLWMDSMSYLVFAEAERATPYFYELGEDCSGPNQVICHCQQCKARTCSESDDAHIIGVRTAQIVRDVQSRRAIQ
jgi:hypothetical protein